MKSEIEIKTLPCPYCKSTLIRHARIEDHFGDGSDLKFRMKCERCGKIDFTGTAAINLVDVWNKLCERIKYSIKNYPENWYSVMALKGDRNTRSFVTNCKAPKQP